MFLKNNGDPFIQDVNGSYPFDLAADPEFIFMLLQEHPEAVTRLRISSSAGYKLQRDKLLSILASNDHLVELHISVNALETQEDSSERTCVDYINSPIYLLESINPLVHNRTLTSASLCTYSNLTIPYHVYSTFGLF